MRRTQVSGGRANSLCSNRARQFLGAFVSKPGRQASFKGEKGCLEGFREPPIAFKYVLGVLWAFTVLTAANNGVSPTNKISEIIWKDHIQQSRTRKEIKRLTEKVQQKGLTLVPLRLYFNDRGRVKLELALGRGEKNHDRRDTIKKREAGREIDRAMKESRS
ncbi:MAG TPA: SsrA-binding protein [Nitrospirales bacterium]|nr:SsrA-binding protein [Nitrospirales bacterium]